MKIRSLSRSRASWRAHFLAVAREAQGLEPQPARKVRAGLNPRVRALATAIRARVLPATAAA